MSNKIPCFTDSEENRFPSYGNVENDTRTNLEKSLEWLCEEWHDALIEDNFDTWYSVRMMIYGSLQALNYCNDELSMRGAMMTLGQVAFQHSLDCIEEGKYDA